MKQINYKSDFDFILKLQAIGADGNATDVGFPDYDFEVILSAGCTGYSTRTFVASCIGGECKNCFNDGGQLHIVCDNHKLGVGVLQAEFKAYLPNDIYADGTKLNVEPQSLGIELVVGAGDDATASEVELMLPYIYHSAYALAVASGYEGSMEDYLRLSAELPEAVETAKLVKQSVDSLAESASSLSASAEAISSGATSISESATKIESNAQSLSESTTSISASADAFEMLSSEYVSGRKAIAQALTNRNYPTEPSESFHAMADKITNMSYEEGWFAKIGYTDDNDGGIKDALNYSYELAKGWNPDGSTAQIFNGNVRMKFAPNIDTSQVVDMRTMYSNCTSLCVVPLIDAKNAIYMHNMFYGCIGLNFVSFSNTDKNTNSSNMFNGCTSLRIIQNLDMSSVTNVSGIFTSCTALVFATMTNIGKSTLKVYNFNGATNWGMNGEENRQSLIDSLITYSYDRASNGMATATITLSANTKALLTEEEIAQMTAKGFTIS